MAPAVERDRTHLLAEEMVGLAYADLAADDIEQVKRLVLDHVGVAYRGATLAWGLALTSWAETLGSQGPCVLFANPLRAAPSVAALVNATAAHGMELDDTHDESITHPGAVVIATALAEGGFRVLHHARGVERRLAVADEENGHPRMVAEREGGALRLGWTSEIQQLEKDRRQGCLVEQRIAPDGDLVAVLGAIGIGVRDAGVRAQPELIQQ